MDSLGIYIGFPSPLGVIFSLIKITLLVLELKEVGVSVSSRSYILSYFNGSVAIHNEIYGFRLLSELYSLLSYRKFWNCN